MFFAIHRVYWSVIIIFTFDKLMAALIDKFLTVLYLSFQRLQVFMMHPVVLFESLQVLNLEEFLFTYNRLPVLIVCESWGNIGIMVKWRQLIIICLICVKYWQATASIHRRILTK